jgi:hypothetical protein
MSTAVFCFDGREWGVLLKAGTLLFWGLALCGG